VVLEAEQHLHIVVEVEQEAVRHIPPTALLLTIAVAHHHTHLLTVVEAQAAVEVAVPEVVEVVAPEVEEAQPVAEDKENDDLRRILPNNSIY
jgi:hypothetical protein